MISIKLRFFLTVILAGIISVLLGLAGNYGGFFRIEGFIAGTLLSTIVSLAFVYYYAAPLGNAVKKMIEMTEGIVQGDLTGDKKAYFDKKLGEIHLLGINIGKMVKGMKKYINEVKVNTENLGSAIKNISVSTGQVSSGSQEQAVHSQQVQEAVHRLSATAGESMDNAMEAARSFDLTSQTALEGEMSLNRLLEGMRLVNEKMNALSGQTEKIGEILSVIEGIASQTNLLSLNAAIEASRAGEHGRGFAVVAEEIRKLASVSAESTREISILLGDIQSSTAEAAAAVDEGKSLGESTEKSFKQIGDLIKSNAQMVKLIEAGSREQAAGAGQMVESITSIAAVAEEASACAEETAASAQEVESLANNLKIVVNVFKT